MSNAYLMSDEETGCRAPEAAVLGCGSVHQRCLLLTEAEQTARDAMRRAVRLTVAV